MQQTPPARGPLRPGRLLWGIVLVLAAPAFALWMAVTGLLSALAAASITVDAVGSIPPLVEAGQTLLSAFALWAMFVSAAAGLVVLILLGVQNIQSARRAPGAAGPTFGSVLWGWAFAIPLATGVGALAGLLLRPVADSIGSGFSLEAGPGTGVDYDDAAYGLIVGGAWLLAALVGLVIAVILTVRFARTRRQQKSDQTAAGPR